MDHKIGFLESGGQRAAALVQPDIVQLGEGAHRHLDDGGAPPGLIDG
jgi:hypothetical protein